jgi:AAA-like domain/TIR domain
LANDLRAGLTAAGHKVFIDVGMRVGTDWVAEIEERIDWCDALIVLLSEASIHSEMVLGEVRMAHRKRRRDGRPRVLPVRVRYYGSLDYELESYLARIQYLPWEGPGDTARALDEILTALGPGEEIAWEPPLGPSPVDLDPRRPQPSEDVRSLFPPPGGTIKLRDDFYVRRLSDDLIDAIAIREGETLAIKAPRQFGKSSLLVRYLARCGSRPEGAGQPTKRFALVDFQSFTDAELADYTILLTRLGEQILRGFRLDVSQVPKIDSQAKLSDFIEDRIFPQIAPPLTLAFDEVDRVLGRAYQSDFFSMLRLWHNRRAEPLSPWERVDLALAHATEPYLLIDSKDRSPFNVAIPIVPQPFARAVLDDLSDRYGGVLTTSELDGLHELLAGHPFLTRLAFYRLVTGHSASFGDLDKHAAEPEGPFGDHLRGLMMLLQQQQGLLPAMRQVITEGSVREDDAFYRLHGAGLVRHEEGRVKPATLLYARFFKGLG